MLLLKNKRQKTIQSPNQKIPYYVSIQLILILELHFPQGLQNCKFFSKNMLISHQWLYYLRGLLCVIAPSGRERKSFILVDEGWSFSFSKTDMTQFLYWWEILIHQREDVGGKGWTTVWIDCIIFYWVCMKWNYVCYCFQ